MLWTTLITGYLEMESKAPTFTRVGPGFDDTVVIGVTGG